MADVTAIVLAAGKGTRMNAGENKVFLPLLGKSILGYSLEKFEGCDLIAKIVVVTAKHEQRRCRQQIIKCQGFTKVIKIVAGGTRRQDSVKAGLEAIGQETKLVVVHDGARPLFSGKLLQKCIEVAGQGGTAIAAVPVKDTIKIAGPDGRVEATLDRNRLWAVQTPQVFSREILLEAHLHADLNGIEATDDAFLVEQLGIKVQIVPGEYHNLKITTPEDLLLAEAILRSAVER